MFIHDIKINANAIWNLLSQRECVTVREIAELTNFKETAIVLALGWLAKENKITLIETDAGLSISLKQVLTDIYY